MLGCAGSGVEEALADAAKLSDARELVLKGLAGLGEGFLEVYAKLSEAFEKAAGLADAAKAKKDDVKKYFEALAAAGAAAAEKVRAIPVEAAEKEVTGKIAELIEKLAAAADDVAKHSGGGDDLGKVEAAANAANGALGKAGSSKDMVPALKTIIEEVLGANEGNPEAGDTKGAAGAAGANDGKLADRAKLSEVNDANKGANGAAVLVTKGAGGGNDGVGLADNGALGAAANAAKTAADATKAVASVSGADILKAISVGKAAKFAEETNAGANDGAAGAEKLHDATIAGAIALRAMAKDGTFANHKVAAGDGAAANAANYAAAVKAAASGAVSKALSTLTIAIRKKIDTELKALNDKARLAIGKVTKANNGTPNENDTGKRVEAKAKKETAGKAAK
ncbi:variable large family protein [Candidatus Borreliella tachyglossi]|uniref:variable large family protein n=1 Tax=Candidatus Borreliella tachyglossi TaxID=1964448 RepID=UPI0040413061